MIVEALARYFHFISILVMVCAIAGEAWLIKPRLQRRAVKQLFVLDSVYGLSALSIVGVGLLLWFGVGKPDGYYTSNWVFHLKLGLFTGMAVLSIWPTVFFFKNRKGDSADWVEIPSRILIMIRLELLLLLFIPLCATLMARGFGQIEG
jgi:putative membrane protein